MVRRSPVAGDSGHDTVETSHVIKLSSGGCGLKQVGERDR